MDIMEILNSPQERDNPLGATIDPIDPLSSSVSAPFSEPQSPLLDESTWPPIQHSDRSASLPSSPPSSCVEECLLFLQEPLSAAPVSLLPEEGSDLQIEEANSPADAEDDTHITKLLWDDFIEDPNPNPVVELASAQEMEMGNSEGKVHQASILKETLTDFGQITPLLLMRSMMMEPLHLHLHHHPI
jgi:hypothetical protein